MIYCCFLAFVDGASSLGLGLVSGFGLVWFDLLWLALVLIWFGFALVMFSNKSLREKKKKKKKKKNLFQLVKYQRARNRRFL